MAHQLFRGFRGDADPCFSSRGSVAAMRAQNPCQLAASRRRSLRRSSRFQPGTLRSIPLMTAQYVPPAADDPRMRLHPMRMMTIGHSTLQMIERSTWYRPRLRPIMTTPRMTRTRPKMPEALKTPCDRLPPLEGGDTAEKMASSPQIMSRAGQYVAISPPMSASTTPRFRRSQTIPSASMRRPRRIEWIRTCLMVITSSLESERPPAKRPLSFVNHQRSYDTISCCYHAS